MNMPKKALPLLILSLVGFVVDRWLKLSALDGSTAGSNTGAHFGLFPNPAIAFSISFPKTLSLILIPIVLIGFVWWGMKLFREQRMLQAAGLVLVIVAALSNYFDRLRYGYVVDYVYLGQWFPIFNLSDVLIVIGLVVAFL